MAYTFDINSIIQPWKKNLIYQHLKTPRVARCSEGLKPGKHFGQILAQLFEAQLDGVFATREDGIGHFRKNREKLV